MESLGRFWYYLKATQGPHCCVSNFRTTENSYRGWDIWREVGGEAQWAKIAIFGSSWHPCYFRLSVGNWMSFFLKHMKMKILWQIKRYFKLVLRVIQIFERLFLYVLGYIQRLEAAPSSGPFLDKSVLKISRFIDAVDASSMLHMLQNLISMIFIFTEWFHLQLLSGFFC